MRVSERERERQREEGAGGKGRERSRRGRKERGRKEEREEERERGREREEEEGGRVIENRQTSCGYRNTPLGKSYTNISELQSHPTPTQCESVQQQQDISVGGL